MFVRPLLLRSLISLSFGLLLIFPSKESFAQGIDPRIKAVGKMALYGTASGALLGTASLAFGAEGRWVARGASIGLYAGLLFGTYVVASHHYRQKRRKDQGGGPPQGEEYYPDSVGPYDESPPPEEENYNNYYYWPEPDAHRMRLRQMNFKKSNAQRPEVYFNLLNISF